MAKPGGSGGKGVTRGTPKKTTATGKTGIGRKASPTGKAVRRTGNPTLPKGGGTVPPA